MSQNEGKSIRHVTRRSITVFSGSLVILGIVLTILSFFMPDGNVQKLVFGIGMALAPSGTLGFITNYLVFGRLMEDVKQSTTDLSDKTNNLSDAITQGTRNLGGVLTEKTKDLDDEIKSLKVSTDFLKRSSELGLEMIYHDRATALSNFTNYMRDEACQENGRLYIVGSSVRGLTENISDIDNIIQNALSLENVEDRFVQKKPKKNFDLRILLTHPEYSHFRENQEDRPTGAIEDEIFDGLRKLEATTPVDYPNPPDHYLWNIVRMYKGTPTCFMIVAGNHMLINPYPYEEEAFKSFCIVVRKVEGGTPYDEGRTIYSQYLRAHMEKPWARNAVGYRHFWLEGPCPDMAWDRRSCYGDVFVVQNASHFYLTVYLNGNGKASYRGLPTSIPCDKEETNFIKLPSQFMVRLYSRQENNWVDLVYAAEPYQSDQDEEDSQQPNIQIQSADEPKVSKDNGGDHKIQKTVENTVGEAYLLYLHSERRRGKVSFRVKGHFMNDFQWIGLFDKQGHTVNPNVFKDTHNEKLEGKQMPFFYVEIKKSEDPPTVSEQSQMSAGSID